MIAEETEKETTSQDDPVKKSVRWLPLSLLCFFLIILNTGWIANSEMKTGVTEITISTLFIGVAFILFVITLINLAVRRVFTPHLALNQPELLALYSILSISSVVAGVGNMGFFTPFLTNVFWYATKNNGYRAFWHLLPPYIGPRNPAILLGYYEGGSTVFQPAVLRAWALPLCVWGIFFLFLLWTTLCLAAIMRRRWEEEEHLPFPVIALPLEMTKEGAPIYRNKLLWIGFAFPAFFNSLNSAATIVPNVPSFPINTARNLAAGLTYPWNGIAPLFGGIHAAGIGFGYLINTDVLFSMWFFYLVRKVLNLWGVTEDWRDPSQAQLGDGSHQFPFTSYQAWGAWLALGIALIWQGRGHFKGYFHRALHGDPKQHDQHEPMSARLAVFGFLTGFLGLCFFVWSSGGSLWLPVVFLGIYVLFMLALARLEAETAVLSPYLGWVTPQSLIANTFGTANLSHMDSVHLGMLSWFNNDYRAAALPHQLQAFVAQKRSGGSMRPMPIALMVAGLVSLVSALLWDLQLYYVNGGETGHVNQWRIREGSMPWDEVQKWLQHPAPPNGEAALGMLVGAGVTLFLTLMRARFVGFPLVPSAYVLDTSWANDLFWLDIFIAWVLKSLLLRYGGMRTYRQMLPLFLGLILGDFVSGAVWSIVGMALHLSLFRTFST